MKDLLSILVFCLVSEFVVASEVYLPHKRRAFLPVVSGGTCSTYDTTNAWDNFIEGFQIDTSGYESNVLYSVWITNGVGNVNYAFDSSSLTTGKPPGACNQCWRIVLPTDGTEAWARADLGAAIDIDTIQTDLTISIYVESGPGTSKSYFIAIWGTSATAVSWAVGLDINNNAGQLQLRARATSTVTVNISAGQWYTAVISLDTARAVGGSTLYVYSEDSLVNSGTFQRNASDIRYIFIGGPNSLDSGDSGTLDFDLITIKTN